MSLETTLDSIFTHLRTLGRPIALKRRPGLKAADIRAKIASVGLDSPPDLVHLYEVCDGTDTVAGDIIDKILFFPGNYWLSLDEALEIYKSMSPDSRWNREWLPIFADGGGDFYIVICDKNSPNFGSVVDYMLGEDDQLVQFESVATMFQTIDRSFAEKAFYVADGYLEADLTKMSKIVEEIQPDFIVHEAV